LFHHDGSGQLVSACPATCPHASSRGHRLLGQRGAAIVAQPARVASITAAAIRFALNGVTRPNVERDAFVAHPPSAFDFTDFHVSLR
jgi:hypothetical protein